MTAYFSIGDVIERIPMFERSPGNHYGEFHALPMDVFSGEVVSVHVRDKFGWITSQPVPRLEVVLE